MTQLLGLPARLLRRHRRLAAALFAAFAAYCIVVAARPAAPPTVDVLVAARDLPGGITLAAADVTVVEISRHVAPDAALAEPGPVVGRVLAAALDRGVPITARSVIGSDLAGSTPGRVLAPLRLPDPGLAPLLPPGTVIDVVAPGEDGAQLVASAARVVSLPAQGDGGGPFGGSADTRGLLIIVEVSPAEAQDLAQAAAHAELSVALR